MAKTMASAERRAAEDRKQTRWGKRLPSSGEVISSAGSCVHANFVTPGRSTSEQVGSRLPSFSGREESGDAMEASSSTNGTQDSVSGGVGRGVLLRQHGNNNILRDFPCC